MEETAKKAKFSAIAFDLDGTLYPNYRFYLRLLPFLLKELRYLLAFGKARNRLRRESMLLQADWDPAMFYEIQAGYMAEILKIEPAIILERTNKLIYRGWEPLFKNLKLFPHVKETLSALRKTGIKMGLLSDFPTDTKIEYLGISGFWDTVLCSEVSGRIKPDPLPFQKLAEALGLPPEQILYVGNSFSYDIIGAQKAGMKAAWIRPGFRFLGRNKEKVADFAFNDYRQLLDFVLI